MSKANAKPTDLIEADSLPSPTAHERAAIEAARGRLENRAPRVRIKVEAGKPKSVRGFSAPHSDCGGWAARMQDAFGSRGTDFAETELHRFITASRLKDGKVDPVRLNAFLAVVDGVRPSNEMEAMLASQMAITHGFAMDLMQVARSADKIPQFESAGHMVAKLLRAFATHAELLHKMKRGGEQRVRVEHVHVHHGGQAIVGNVSPGRTGIEKIENQPHAPQTDAEDQPRSLTSEQGTPMPRPYPEREPVPLTVRKGQEPVPHARRRAR